MNLIKQRILIDRDNFNKKWVIKKKYYNNNNYLTFSLKWYLVTLIRFLTNKKFDHNLNLISLIISILISLPRSMMVRFVRIIDLFFPPFFGAINTKIVRNVDEIGSSVRMSTSNKGIDLRMSLWKRDALEIIVNLVKKSDFKKIRFIEIGAASGIISIIFADWAKKNDISFKSVCIEPSFSNIDFLHETVVKHNYDIRIIPCAVNKKEKWTSFELDPAGTKGLLGDAVLNKENQVYKLSTTINEILSVSFKPNIIYIDALLNESLILEQLLETDLNSVKIIVEFDYGVTEIISKKCKDLNLEIKKIDKVHYLIFERNDQSIEIQQSINNEK